MPTIRIDPKMFINKPYVKCPKCGKKNFGVLSINSYSYTRRCIDCRFDKSYPLPKLKKKIIYLDQFAISEMVKSIDPSLGKMGKVLPFFRNLFETLDKLNKFQLIICPDSENHFDESIVSSFYKQLKRLYEQLSHGFTFYDPATIKRFQINEASKAWLGEKPKLIEIDDILRGTGSLDGWQERFFISVNLRDQNFNLPQQLRRVRDEASRGLSDTFKRWQKENNRKFKDWYLEELNAIGPALLKNYWDGVLKINEDLKNGVMPFVSDVAVTMTSLHKKLQAKGFNDEEVMVKSAEFFRSEFIKEIPYHKISSMMYAALAHDAANGRKKIPTAGMLSDIDAIASYAPYCDVMFIDSECRRLLNYGMSQTKYHLKTKFFAPDTKDEFLKYLNGLEKRCSKEHMNKVKEVYGQDWGKPYIEMFETKS